MARNSRVLLSNDKTEDLALALQQAHPDIEYATCNSYAEMPRTLSQFRPDVVYTVRFNGTQGFPRDALFASDGPAWIANGGAGVDHFGNWDPSRVTVTNAAGVAADMMSEYVLGGFLHFTLDVPGLQKDKSQKHWAARMMTPLKGKTLLVIGLGHTGRALALRAKAFGMYVIGTRATGCVMENVDEVHGADALHTLLPRADFIAVATPLTEKTRGLLSWELFETVKHGAVFADVSRGGVVDQAALRDALQSGILVGAVLDVFEQEPLPEDDPLWQARNVLISPHCSSVYEGWETASFDLFLRNLDNWLAGRELFNAVDPAKGY